MGVSMNSLSKHKIALMNSARAASGWRQLAPVVAVMALALPTPAWSQASDDVVVVTGSRISNPGFQAPTPVTSISEADFQVRGTTNIVDTLNQFPSFYGTTTPSTTTLEGTRNGQNTVNLRGLGENRTLVLIDGRRHVPSNAGGTVDLNVIPSMAVKRVDVVTGGASAAYGSDAVAGVVNILLDHDLEGMRANLQAGETTYGDGANILGSLAFGGKFASGKGSFLFAGEYNKDFGVLSQGDRPWGAKAFALTNNPSNLSGLTISQNARLAIGNEGGVIKGPAAINNLTFGPGGTLLKYDPGIAAGGTFQVGGDGGNLGQYRDLSSPYERQNLFTSVNYDLSDNVTVYFEGSFGRSHAQTKTVQSFDFGETIQSDNAFIPAALKTILTANNLSSFTMFRINTDIGFITADTDKQVIRGVLGAKGKFLNTWTWDAYYQTGRTSVLNQELNNRIQQNFAWARDAVLNGAGQIVCRATLTGQAPGCVPINLFGNGSPSAAAINYVNGTEYLRNSITQSVVAASAQGELFDLPAGPVKVALGVEHREDSVSQSAGSLSVANAYIIGNFKPISGSMEVTEGFTEVDVPLISGVNWIDRLDFNAAARATGYQFGTVVSWKAGLNYKPIADLRLRGTISRDIRAPNIGELFTATGLSFTNVSDPTRNNANTFVQVITGGNPLLKPEYGLTTTAGFVYQPSWFSGFNISADFFEIEMKGLVGTLGAQNLVNTCVAGIGAACAAITRDSSGVITSINQNYINIAETKSQGVDLETSYSTDLQDFGIGGDLTMRLVGTWMNLSQFSADGRTFTNSIGSLGQQYGGLPRYRGQLSANYHFENWNLFSQLRYLSSGQVDTHYSAATFDPNINHMPSRTYVDLTASYDFKIQDADFQLYAGARNLFDVEPPIGPNNFISPIATSVLLYDQVGRYVFMGVRTSL
jgi:outer membrane receptor protein involved in Fe transport